ncbi:hypothetical protein V5O48_005445 [Marasmius crinis-equi]|uniref:Uncharacterized protein n=1 Tax=Marasmius crinis-equi TaxID=585013 RepID=A0ABR3FMY7_9AGAR
MLASRPISRNGDGMPRLGAAKTPARGLQNENALRNGPMTVGKSKGNIPQTPFQPKGMKGGEAPQTGKGKAPIQLNTISRPFLDKTPFPNRVISLQNHTPFERDLSETPDSAQRPSSTRKHIRLPRHSQKFETPLNTKNHWDISDDEIELPVPAAIPQAPEVQEDYDEVEYMPPNTLDVPYQPPIDFELPDYKEVGQVLMGLSRNMVLEEPQPPPDITLKDGDIGQNSWPVLWLAEDDDPFRVTRSKEQAKSSTRTSAPTTRNAKPVPVPQVTRTRSIPSTTRIQSSRPATASSATRPSAHARTTSTSTTTNRTAPKTTVTRPARVPPANIVAQPSRTAVTKAPTAPSRRPATSASTYKPRVPTATRSGVHKSTLTTGPARAAQRPGAVKKASNTRAEEPVDTITYKVDTNKDEGDDFLFDV